MIQVTSGPYVILSTRSRGWVVPGRVLRVAVTSACPLVHVAWPYPVACEAAVITITRHMTRHLVRYQAQQRLSVNNKLIVECAARGV